MHLLDLANELLLMIGEELDTKSLSQLLATNHLMYSLMNPILERLALKNFEDDIPSLHWAVYHAHKPLVRLLLRKGVDIDSSSTKFGMTPLHWACVRATPKHVPIARLLLSKGAAVDQKDLSGHTPLQAALRVPGSHVKDIVEVLLKAGANVNVQDVQGGKTPYITACIYCAGVVELLVRYGADTRVEDEYFCGGEFYRDLGARVGSLALLLALQEDSQLQRGDVNINRVDTMR